uniref:ATP synthase subunit a n=1 Tax=Amphiporus formidabilis TaxID=187592 RepID=X2C8U2_9BILA|nr:ATP synthase F0 subunit 6 [Amphiporus formidabilis]AGL46760.1 ATP synthase F0 subunit 6 [Amphiporus formidabilis]
MLSDIFSSFDEQNGNVVGSFFIWFFCVFLFFCFVSVFWVGGTRLVNCLSLFVEYLWGQSSRSVGGDIRGFSFFVAKFFFFLVFCNFLGLVPYVFSGTSHLVITFSVAVPLWFSLLLSSLFWSPIGFFSHFLPSGAPAALNPFLVLVETVSVAVRPITLSVRLAANMGAGHIVIGLIGTYLVGAMFCSGVVSGVFLFFIESFYFVFEFGICLVQGYIFSLLLVLYSDEHSF